MHHAGDSFSAAVSSAAFQGVCSTSIQDALLLSSLESIPDPDFGSAVRPNRAGDLTSWILRVYVTFVEET